MSTPNDGGPAFPNHGDGPEWDGMTLRDWFAGMAMQGATGFVNEHYAASLAHTAEASYKIADAMLAARESKNQSS